MHVRVIPVVIRADLMAAGDHSGWKLLTYAAAPATWGQAIEVPESMSNLENRLSPLIPVRDDNSEYAASMLSPGAAMSGCPGKLN